MTLGFEDSDLDIGAKGGRHCLERVPLEKGGGFAQFSLEAGLATHLAFVVSRRRVRIKIPQSRLKLFGRSARRSGSTPTSLAMIVAFQIRGLGRYEKIAFDAYCFHYVSWRDLTSKLNDNADPSW
jgi:hypothetical protein